MVLLGGLAKIVLWTVVGKWIEPKVAIILTTPISLQCPNGLRPQAVEELTEEKKALSRYNLTIRMYLFTPVPVEGLFAGMERRVRLEPGRGGTFNHLLAAKHLLEQSVRARIFGCNSEVVGVRARTARFQFL